MKHVAEFKRVSFEQFSEGMTELMAACGETLSLEEAYSALKTPVRATVGSAGYDFFAPCAVTVRPGEAVKVPTGFRVKVKPGWVLQIFPRSGLGFKYRLQLNNTVGIIDSDYFFADNEGHIFIKIFNDGREEKTVSLKQGEAFAQGVFLPFGITKEDYATARRTGGFGSTSKG